MTDAYERWRQSKCCCPTPDPRECIQIRYDIREDPEDPWNGLVDDVCECACHDEYAEDAEDDAA